MPKSSLNDLTTDELIQKLCLVSDELILVHDDLGVLLWEELQAKADAWEQGAFLTSVTIREKESVYASKFVTSEVIKARAKISILNEQKSLLTNIINWRKGNYETWRENDPSTIRTN